MIKKYMLVAVFLLMATNVWAAKSWDVSKTRHNLSSTSDPSKLFPIGNQYISNEDEVCIFCHTPHGGTLNTPLWNRSLPAGAFTHYANARLSTLELRTALRPINPESLLCMSCHDGTVAEGNMTKLVNFSNEIGQPVIPGNPDGTIQPLGSWNVGIGPVIGDVPDGVNNPSGLSGQLGDDHPISFNYADVMLVPANAAKLKSVALAEGSGVRFFPLSNVGAEKRVECSSCHDPHVNYEKNNGGDMAFTPFLVMSNNGSNLCLSCHIK